MTKIYRKNEVLDLFRELQIEYIADNKVNNELIIKADKKKTEYYNNNLDEFTRLTELYGNYIRKSFVAPVYIGKTQSQGYGLFTLKPILKDSFIGIYTGEVKEALDLIAYDETGFDTDYAWDYPDDIQGLQPQEIDAKYSGNEMRFANHENNPNLNVEHTVVNNQWYIFLVARENIDMDCELTISYGHAYWDTEYRQMS